MKNVFIIGSKGIPSNYGGFETFVEKLTANKKKEEIKYHVACLAKDNNEFIYNNSRCFNVNVPEIGSAKAVFYDLKALDAVYKYVVNNNLNDSIVYVLACRIGPFIKYYKNKFAKLNIPIFVNPDGHEWKRAKWNKAVRMYWKYSEKLMVKYADLMICDSEAIEKYIKLDYKRYQPKTTFIAYGATVNMPEESNSNKYEQWLENWSLTKDQYYLIVGRMVPENNYDLMIKEFLKSSTEKSLVIVTDTKNPFYEELKKSVNFETDNRVKFVGTIYDQDLLFQVRSGAFAYLHGHEVGGTNPSLLEAMATTSLNILLDVNFNREVGVNTALYFNKLENGLAETISKAEKLSKHERISLGNLAKDRINNVYSWDFIIDKYESVFLGSEK